MLGNNCNTIGTIAILLLGIHSLLGQYYSFQIRGGNTTAILFYKPCRLANEDIWQSFLYFTITNIDIIQ